MQLLIQLVGNFTVFRKNSEEKIPETQVKSQAGSRRDPANPTWDPGWD